MLLQKNRGECDLGRVMSLNIIKAVNILSIFLLLEFLTFRIQDIIKFCGLGKLLFVHITYWQ